jgi:hypothetical protein
MLEEEERDGFEEEHLIHITFLEAADGDHPNHKESRKRLWVGKSGEGIETELTECCAKWMVETINKKYPHNKYRAVEANELIDDSIIPPLFRKV